MGATAGQAFLQLIQLPLRSVETHSRVGGQLLIRLTDRQTLELCGGLSIHLHHPRLNPRQIPSLHHRGEGITAAGLLLHRQMGEQRRLTVSRGQQSVAQLGFLAQVHLQHMAMGRGPIGLQHLQQIQARLLLHQQHNPGGRQTSSTGQHQLQGSYRTTHPQGQHLPRRGMVEFHRPATGTAAAIQGVTQRLLQFHRGEDTQSLRQSNTVEGVTLTIEHQPVYTCRGRGECKGRHNCTQGEPGQRLQAFEVREPPRLLAAGRQTQPLQRGPTALLNRCQHRACHGQATPWAASSLSTQS